jgi:hypothetical protein
MFTECSYGIYLMISIPLTIWVARTLFQHGRIFLVDTFDGNVELADAVNRLLVVGFYLINVGYVTVALRYGDQPHDLKSAIEVLSTKLGAVMLILGGMHFLNLYVFTRMRKHAVDQRRYRKMAGGDPANDELTPVDHTTLSALLNKRDELKGQTP